MPVPPIVSCAPPQHRWSGGREVFGNPALLEKIAHHLDHPRDVLAAASVTSAGRRATRNLRTLRLRQADTASNFHAYEQARLAAEHDNLERAADWRPRSSAIVRRYAYDQPAHAPGGVQRSLAADTRRWLASDLARLGYAEPEYSVRAAAFDGCAGAVKASMREVLDAAATGAPGAGDAASTPLLRMTISLAQLAQRDAITGKNIAALLALREEQKIIACETPAARLHALLHAVRERNMFATEFYLSMRNRFAENGSFLMHPTANPAAGLHAAGTTYAFSIEHAAVTSGSLSMARRIAQISGTDFNRPCAGLPARRPIDLAIAARDIPLIAFFAELHTAGRHIEPGAMIHHAIETHDPATLRAVLALPFADPNLIGPADAGPFLPIHFAAQNGNTEMLRILLADPRIDIHALDMSGSNVVSYVAGSHAADRDEMLALIADLPLSWTQRDEYEQTPLHAAALAQNVHFFDAALGRRDAAQTAQAVNFFARDVYGATPFDLFCTQSASDAQAADFMRMLDIYEGLGPQGVSAVKNVVALLANNDEENVENLRMVLARGYDVNAHIPEQLPPAVYTSVFNESLNIFEVLLARPELRIENFRDCDLYHRRLDTFLLQRYKQIVDDPTEDSEDEERLEYAGNTFDQFVKSMHFQDERSGFLHAMIAEYSAVPEATRQTFLPRFDAYLSRADLNLSGTHGGTTPLHSAARLGDKRLVERLIRHARIRPEIRDGSGRTAAELAVEHDNAAIFSALIDHPATPPPVHAIGQPADWPSYVVDQNAVNCIGALCAKDAHDFMNGLRAGHPLLQPAYRAITGGRHAALKAICEDVPAHVLLDADRGDGYIHQAIAVNDADSLEILLDWSVNLSQKHLAAAVRAPLGYPDVLHCAIAKRDLPTCVALAARPHILAEILRAENEARTVAAALAENARGLEEMLAAETFDPQMRMNDGRNFIDHIIDPLNRKALALLVRIGKIDRAYTCRDGYPVEYHLTRDESAGSATLERRSRASRHSVADIRALTMPASTEADAEWIDSVLR